MERLRASAARQVRTLVGGGAVILVSTIILALLFLQGIIQRLDVLRDNARRFAEGKPLNAPLVGRDEITEVDRAFHDMAANLGQQKQENEMFVYSVSHDLRSPLVNLQGFSEELSLSCGDLRDLFRRDDVPGPVRERGLQLMDRDIEESIRFIQAAVGRLARIIDALLRLSLPAGSSTSGRRSTSVPPWAGSLTPCTTRSPPRALGSPSARCRRPGATRRRWSRSSPT